MLKILIIDDEPIVRNRLKSILELDGFHAFVAESGSQGINIFKKENPDVVILDVILPGVDSLEILRHIKIISNNTEVFIFSGQVSMASTVNYIKEGASKFFEKPLDYTKILKSLKNVIGKKEIGKQLNQKSYVFNDQPKMLNEHNKTTYGIAFETNDIVKEKQKTILLVEDDAIISMDGKLTLERFGYKVIEAKTGEKALKIVETNRGIDLILMDISLGSGIDGFQAAKKIFEKHDLPLIFMSSHTKQEVIDKAEKITPYGYIIKNLDEIILSMTIKMAFRLYESKMREKAKERKLSKNEEKFNNLIDNYPYGIQRINKDGVIVYANNNHCEMYGYEKKELIGRSIIDFLHPCSQSIELSEYLTFLCENQPKPTPYYQKIVKKDGENRDIIVSWNYQRNKEREIQGFTSILTDITQCKLNCDSQDTI